MKFTLTATETKKVLSDYIEGLFPLKPGYVYDVLLSSYSESTVEAVEAFDLAP